MNLKFSALTQKAFRTRSLRILYIVLFIVPAAFLNSCRDEEDELAPDVIENPENAYVNDWIKENMDFWYLWNTEMPANGDRNAAPKDYFSALLSDDDRFSWIQENYQELLKSLQGINKEAGYEYVLYRENSSGDKVVAQIMYVKPGSPAEKAGLKRGDVISSINGKTITTTNYRDVVGELKDNHTVVYKQLNEDFKSFGSEKTASLNTLEFVENPNFLSKIIEVNDRKIGYYVYNFFATGTGTNVNGYDAEMDQVFANFKSNGITDLVIDLRYNSGGSEVSAKNLASLVGKGVAGSKVFFKRQYNTQVTEEIKKDPKLGESFLTSLFLDKGQNVGSQLTNGRVYILTSSRTASASELIINSLKPYMEVFIIGDVTYGKNVGSISLYEENDTKNRWGLQPIVVKVANSIGFADYGDGFQPDIRNEDKSLFIYPLGDARENLLAEAISAITGIPITGRVAAKSENREVLHHSLDEKRRGYDLIMEEGIPGIR